VADDAIPERLPPGHPSEQLPPQHIPVIQTKAVFESRLFEACRRMGWVLYAYVNCDRPLACASVAHGGSQRPACALGAEQKLENQRISGQTLCSSLHFFGCARHAAIMSRQKRTRLLGLRVVRIGMRMKGEFTAIIEEAPEGGYWAISPEVPGANGQGESVEEAKSNLREAIRLILDDRLEDARRGLPDDAIQTVVAI